MATHAQQSFYSESLCDFVAHPLKFFCPGEFLEVYYDCRAAKVLEKLGVRCWIAISALPAEL